MIQVYFIVLFSFKWLYPSILFSSQVIFCYSFSVYLSDIIEKHNDITCRNTPQSNREEWNIFSSRNLSACPVGHF